jgi:hypothetical protein
LAKIIKGNKFKSPSKSYIDKGMVMGLSPKPEWNNSYFTDDIQEKQNVIDESVNDTQLNVWDDTPEVKPITAEQPLTKAFPIEDLKLEAAKKIIRGTAAFLDKQTFMPQADKDVLMNRAREQAQYELEHGDETITQRFERERQTQPFVSKGFTDPNYWQKTVPESIGKGLGNLAMMPLDIMAQIKPSIDKIFSGDPKKQMEGGLEYIKSGGELVKGFVEFAGKGIGLDESGKELFPRISIKQLEKNYKEDPANSLLGLSVVLGSIGKLRNAGTGKVYTAEQINDFRTQFADWYNKNYSTFAGKPQKPSNLKQLENGRTIDITPVTINEAVKNIYNPVNLLKSNRGSFSIKGIEKEPYQMTAKEYSDITDNLTAAIKLKNGKIIQTGYVHDVPDGVSPSDIIEEGFVTGGKYYNRDQIERLGVGRYSEEISYEEEPRYITHEGIILEAIDEGKTIPEEVKKDFPFIFKDIKNLLKDTRGSFSTKKLEDKGKTIESVSKPSDLPVIGKSVEEFKPATGQKLQIQISNSEPFTADFIENHGEFSVLDINDNHVIVPNDQITILKQTGEHQRSSLFKKKLQSEDIDKNPESIFVLPNLAKDPRTNISYLDIAGMTDANLLDNYNKIDKGIQRIRDKFLGINKPIENEWQLSKAQEASIAKDGWVLKNHGLDKGDIVASKNSSGTQVYYQITDIEGIGPDESKDPTNYIYDKKYIKTNKTPQYINYKVKAVPKPQETKPYRDVVISSLLGNTPRVPLKTTAPQTYAYLIDKLYDLRNMVDRIQDENSRPIPKTIIKNVEPETKTLPKTIQTVLPYKDVMHGTKTIGSDRIEYPQNSVANVINKYKTLEDGTTLYNTDQGILDKEGNEYFEKGKKEPVKKPKIFQEHIGDSKSTKFEPQKYSWGDRFRNSVEAIKGGAKTSTIVPEKDASELIVGQTIAINNYGDEVQVEVVGIDHYVQTKLDIVKDKKGYDVPNNMDLALSIAKTEGLIDRLWNNKTKEYFPKPGSAATYLFNKNKKGNKILVPSARIVFKYNGPVKTKKIVDRTYKKPTEQQVPSVSYQPQFSKEDLQFKDFYDSFKDAIITKNTDLARKIKDKAIEDMVIEESYAKTIAEKILNDVKEDPSRQTLSDFLMGHGIGEATEGIKSFKRLPSETEGLSEEAAKGMGLDPSPGKKEKKVKPYISGKGTETISESYTRTTPTYDGYIETIISGSNLQVLVDEHYKLKRQAFLDGKIKPNTNEATLAFFDHPRLYEDFGDGSKIDEVLQASKVATVSKDTPYSGEVAVDISGETRMDIDTTRRNKSYEDEEQIVADTINQSHDFLGNMFDILKDQGGSAEGWGHSSLFSFADKIKQYFSRKTVNDLKNGTISPEVQAYNDFTSVLRAQLAFIKADSKKMNIPLRDNILNRYVKNGSDIQKATIEADAFMSLYVTPNVDRVVSRSLEKSLMKESLSRPNPNSLGYTAKESAKEMKLETSDWGTQKASWLKKNMNDFYFFKSASPSVRLGIERYYAEKRDLDEFHQRYTITLFNNIHITDRGFVRDLIILNDELSRTVRKEWDDNKAVPTTAKTVSEEEIYDNDTGETFTRKIESTSEEVKKAQRPKIIMQDIGATGRSKIQIEKELNNKFKELLTHLTKTSKPRKINGVLKTEKEVAKIRLDNIKDAINKWEDLSEEKFISLVVAGRANMKDWRDHYAPYVTGIYTGGLTHYDRWSHAIYSSKEPKQQYLKAAGGTAKGRVAPIEIFADYLTSIDSDLQDIEFVNKMAEDHDITSFIPDRYREHWDTDKYGNKYDYAPNGIREDFSDLHLPDGKGIPVEMRSKSGIYVSWTPETSNMIILNDEGNTIIDGYKRTYFTSVENFEALNSLTTPYNPVMSVLNKVTSIFKSHAILSTIGPYNINNLAGDGTITALEHPERQKFSKQLVPAIEFLYKYISENKGKPIEYTSFELQVKDFIEAIKTIEAGAFRADIAQFDIGDVLNIKNAYSRFVTWVGNKSSVRESWLRVANAMYLLEEMNTNGGQNLKQLFGWLPIDQNIDLYDFAGEVSKQFHINYNMQSPTYRRWITNLSVPFGHFYIKGGGNFWRWYTKGDTFGQKAKHGFKAGLYLTSIPFLFSLWNSGLLFNYDEEKAQKMNDIERGLTPGQRNRLHLIFGNYVWSPQYPIDLLPGSKIFGVLGNNLTQLMTGEITPKEFMTKVPKEWLEAEVRGVVFGLNPAARLLTGYISGKDPLDNSRVLSYDRTKEGTPGLVKDALLYLNKCANPLFGGFPTQYYSNNQTTENSLINFAKKLGASKEAFGIREYTKRPRVVVPTGNPSLLVGGGHKDIYSEFKGGLEDLEKEEIKLFNELEESYTRFVDINKKDIETGAYVDKWLKSKDVQDIKNQISTLPYPDGINEEMKDSLNTRLNNIIESTGNRLALTKNLLETEKNRIINKDKEFIKILDEGRLKLEKELANENFKRYPVTIKESAVGMKNKVIRGN